VTKLALHPHRLPFAVARPNVYDEMVAGVVAHSNVHEQKQTTAQLESEESDHHYPPFIRARREYRLIGHLYKRSRYVS
jgi:hypothetical protein